MKTVVIYGSTTGVTETVANIIGSKIDGAEVLEVSNINFKSISEEYDLVILGTSTWGIGDLQDDWFDKVDELKGADFSNKTVAFFGTGDQEGYPDSFISAVRTIYDAVVADGVNIIGFTSKEGYNFDESDAVVDNKFIGLAIDEDNESNKTEDRIISWINQLVEEFKA